jgi:hypothetical protein
MASAVSHLVRWESHELGPGSLPGLHSGRQPLELGQAAAEVLQHGPGLNVKVRQGAVGLLALRQGDKGKEFLLGEASTVTEDVETEQEGEEEAIFLKKSPADCLVERPGHMVVDVAQAFIDLFRLLRKIN